MNKFRAVLQHDFFNFLEESHFSVEYEDVGAHFQYNKALNQLTIELSSKGKNKSDFEEEFERIFLLLFLMMGSCPYIKLISFNDEESDLETLTRRHITHKYYHDLQFRICTPCSKNITRSLLSEFKSITLPDKKISLLSFYLLQILVSKEYEKNVFIAHRLTLLLHAIDGMITKQQGFFKEEITEKIIEEWPEMEQNKENKRINYFFPKLYYLCSETIFLYEDRCKILKVLGKDKKGFLDTLVDTRHFYSHMLPLNERKKRLREGKDIRVYFDILFYSLRLYWLKKMDVNLDDSVIINTYSVFHDWIVDIEKIKDEPYLSGTYLLQQRLIKE